ncbi:hypothetical protein H4R18_005787 [Coemansia javaensis]|uniref:Pkinase-domain-containing protein n=1 Tax=Coemansia javaensis TaxID=2761396 RepID=A0A9W8LEU2_9FUNG|nr:hypothetical protein H4R18_005787 [Coemansia javaensis]
MTSLEDPFDYTQPTQPFEEATQVTQDDASQVAARQKPVGKLVWKRGDQISDHDVFVDTPVAVGRHRSCDIQVTSSVSSNRHCVVSATLDPATKECMVVCEDLSSNGTFWNSKRIGKGNTVIVSHGDVIEIKKGHFFTYLQLTDRRRRGNGNSSSSNGGSLAGADLSQPNGKYQITDTVLGVGTFAEIRRAYQKDTKTEVAVKIMKKRNFSLGGTAGGGTNYIHEVNLLRAIRHPNIVRVYDVDETDREVFIFMPLLKGGDLFDYIRDRGGLPEDQARYTVYQMLLALKYLHDSGIAHRDLKPENTLLVSAEPYSQIMLTDFGMAKAAGRHELMKTMCGTFQYIAPEMLSPGTEPGQPLATGYTTAVDCWSLGVTTYAMVSAMLPFSDEDGPARLFRQIRSGTIDFSYPCWAILSPDCQAFIRRLLCLSPAERMSINDALRHPWIADDEQRLARLYAQSVAPASAAAGSAPADEGRAASARPASPMGPPPAKRQR